MATAEQDPANNGALRAKPHRSRCLVLLVPGMPVTEPKTYLGRLVEGVKEYATNRGINLTEEAHSKADDRHRLVMTGADTIELEFTESYWSDLRPRLSTESGFQKFLGGMSLLRYWTLSPKVWAVSLRRKYMFLSTSATLLLILAWYYGAIATLLSAWAQDPSWFPQHKLAVIQQTLANLGTRMSGFRIWLVVSALTALLPMLTVVDIAYASMAYLLNREQFGTKVKARLMRILSAVQKGDLDRVIVVAHSFGVCVAIEVLSELDAEVKTPISLLTLGGSLGLLRARSPRVETAYARVVKNEKLRAWRDFWSEQDWLGTPAFEKQATGKRLLESNSIDASVSLSDKLTGKSHSLYFSDPEVYKALLEEIGWRPTEAAAAP